MFKNINCFGQILSFFCIDVVGITKILRIGLWIRDGNRSGRPAPVGSTGTGRVAGWVEILRPAGQAGWKTGQILLSGN